MKKIKKLSALLVAYILTAGTVSSLTAGALAHWIDKDEMDKIIENCFPVPEGSNVFGSFSQGMYIVDENSSNYSYNIYLLGREQTNCIEAKISTDANIENIQAAVSEMFPDAEVAEVVQDYDSSSIYNVKIVPLKGYHPYDKVRENDISINNARELYDFLSENSVIDSFNFIEYAATPGITNFGLTTYLDHFSAGSYDKIEEYISEKNLNCHIEEIYGKTEFKVVPDNEISVKEHYSLAEQIYNDLGICADLIIPSSANPYQEFSIDMHNNIAGDANDDGELMLCDAILIMQAVGNPDQYTLTPQGAYNADIAGNYDGITNMDALAVQKKLLNLE